MAPDNPQRSGTTDRARGHPRPGQSFLLSGGAVDGERVVRGAISGTLAAFMEGMLGARGAAGAFTGGALGVRIDGGLDGRRRTGGALGVRDIEGGTDGFGSAGGALGVRDIDGGMLRAGGGWSGAG